MPGITYRNQLCLYQNILQTQELVIATKNSQRTMKHTSLFAIESGRNFHLKRKLVLYLIACIQLDFIIHVFE